MRERHGVILIRGFFISLMISGSACAQPVGVFYPELHLADPTGLTDSTAAINATFDDAAIVQGVVEFCGRYLVNSGNIVQRPHTQAIGCGVNYPGASTTGLDFSTTQSTIIQDPAYTWQVHSNSRIKGLGFHASTLITPTSFTTLAQQATVNMQGTAITLGDGVTSDTGNDVAIDDVTILGYAVGIQANRNARYHFFRLEIDATTCINLNNMFDISTIYGLECWPFTTVNSAWAQATWPVTSVTADGTGQVVLTIGTPSVASATLVSGYPVNVYGITGLGGITGHYPVSVSGENVTLVGSQLSPVTTGILTTTSAQISVTSALGIGIGQTVTGTGIPEATTVLAVNWLAKLVTLSNAPTAPGTGVALTFTSPAYTSGGMLGFNEYRRAGDGITIANAQGLRVIAPFVNSHDIAYHATSGAQGTQFYDAQSDYGSVFQDPQSIGYMEDGTNVFSYLYGGSMASENMAVVLNRAAGAFQGPTLIAGMNLSGYTKGYMIWAGSGRAVASGVTNTGSSGGLYVGDNMGNLVLDAMDLQGLPAPQYQSPGNSARVLTAAAQVSGSLGFDLGTNGRPRVHGLGPSGMSGSLMLPGAGGRWFLGTDANGPGLQTIDPGNPSTNYPSVTPGTGGTPSAAIFGSSNGPAQFTGVGTRPTLLGSPTSAVTFPSGAATSHCPGVIIEIPIAVSGQSGTWYLQACQ